jgi:hypothetical protein
VSVHIKLLLLALALFAAVGLTNESASRRTGLRAGNELITTPQPKPLLTEAPVISKQLKQRAQTTINQFEIAPELLNKAKALQQLAATPEYQQKLKGYEKRVAKAVGIGSLSGSKKTADEKEKSRQDGKYILFISASIPMPTLRRYARDIAKNDGLMVLRGTVGDNDNKLGPTLAFMAEVLKKNPDCEGVNCKYVKANVTIDPRLFVINDIKQVPALIFAKGMDFGGYVGKGQGLSAELPGKAGVVVYGDASFGGMVEGLIKRIE